MSKSVFHLQSTTQPLASFWRGRATSRTGRSGKKSQQHIIKIFFRAA